MTLDYVKNKVLESGFKVFEGDDKEFNLNIVGVRNSNPTIDVYGCALTCFWKFKGEWQFRNWKITTYPGSYFLIKKLLNPNGAAILAPGQYSGVYSLDLHGGRYEALCQRNGAVRVFRDKDRDTEFDMNPKTLDQGWYGINIHAPITPANGYKNYVADVVYNSSAGCQVFKNMVDFFEFRELCRASRLRFGNKFTYTLVNS